MNRLARTTVQNSAARQQGFTLIELMIVIALAAVVMAMAVPSMARLMENIQTASQTNNLMNDLNFARSTAVSQNRTIIVCGSANPTATPPACGINAWSTGWIIFNDQNRNGIFDPVPGTDTDSVLRVNSGVGLNTLTVTDTVAAAVDSITFDAATGYLSNATTSRTFKLCSKNNYSTATRSIIVDRSGRVQRGLNSTTGNPVDVNGAVITCP